MYSKVLIFLLVSLVYSEIVTSQAGFTTYRCASNAAGISSVTTEQKAISVNLYGPYQLGAPCIWANYDSISDYCCFTTNYWYGGETTSGSAFIYFSYVEYTTMTNIVRTLNGVSFDGIHVPNTRMYTINTYTICGNSVVGNDALCFQLGTS